MENSSVSELEVKRSHQLKNVKNPNCLQNEQLTSAPSSTVEDNSVGEIEMKMEENTDQSPMALLPVEIRLMIFKNLDFKSLKNARLVSQSCNIQATPILSDCSQIYVNDFFEMCKNIKTTFPENITPGLIKHIHAPHKSNEVDLQWTYLREFCKEYSNDIIGITADGEDYDYRDVVQHLSNVLIKCPKLQNLSLHTLQHKDVGDKNSRHLRKVIFSKPLLSLKFINLDFDFEWEIPRCEHFLDNLFKAAENLEQLKISGPYRCYYPDLSNNKKLKILQITPYFEIVSIPKINKMIEQLPSSLETLAFLEANCIDSEDNIRNKQSLSFPSNLSQLKVFINKGLFTFRMDSCASLLLNCENLQTLQLAKYFHQNLKITEGFFDGIITHLKLENLQISAEVESESILKTICKIFPNLKKIEFAVGRDRISNVETVWLEDFIINCLEICCSNTKLVDITVTMTHTSTLYFKLSYITKILLESSKLFAGIRTLTFAKSHWYNVSDFSPIDVNDKEIEEFQNALLFTRGLKMFQLKNFRMKATAAVKIEAFVQKNNLPVRFID